MHKSAVRLSALALVLAFAGGVRAADDEPLPEQPADTAEPAPQPTAQVEPVRGVRYRLWLKSGRSMDGVVRAKGVFEVLTHDSGYRPADDDEAGAGVRIWFPQAQDGFIFFPLKDIDRLEELGELSTNEGRTIARARVDAARRAERERFQIKARRAAEEAAAAAEDAGEDEGEAETPVAEQPAEVEAQPAEGEKPAGTQADAGKLAALLLKFPPTRWTLDTPKEIERRKVVLGLFPSDEEKAFLASFDDWKVAYEAWVAATEAADAESDEADEKSGRKAKSSDRREAITR